ncbi:MarR family winged helix-turn-helix transcriptional regulator [Klugiella xanthotipulae]|uniref:MarR family transcriptional regulator n=1 Tax=Klugiella xanthotipulae TaxID=244735 RepID=A0A543HXZ0_9MICO|nr:MarR family transcriptional regulator [Klugiella xanthotipulae]TQM63202.1 MarR family transcriptional regulator [Klugiella xanthotipulae]
MRDNDEVDLIVEAWARARPDLTFDPLHVLSRVTRIAKHFNRIRQNAFNKSELDSWEFDVLAALRREGPPFALSPKRLVSATMVSSGTMTNRIDRMAERGLVSRLTDPNDGRGVLVKMTPAGLTRVDAAITRLVDAEEALLGGLTHTEQARLGTLLRKLRISFDATDL